MKHITKDYDSHTKEELLAEIHSRKIEGVTMSTSKPDMVAALALDDEVDDEVQTQPPEPLPPLKASPIPQVEKTPIAENGSDPCPFITDERFTDGIWVRASDGEDYALCIHDADGYGNTHTARNSEHQWQGKIEQFNAAFSRK